MLDTVIIIGAGMIGSSFARDLQAKALAQRILFIDNDHSCNAEIVGQGFEIGDYPAIANADLVILATPVLTIPDLFKNIVPFLRPQTIVTDVSSTKNELVMASQAILAERFSQFVPGHPIAGKEASGFLAGQTNLFQNRAVILTPINETNADAIQKVKDLWQAFGAQIFMMDPKEHDQCFAKYSHLNHILSFLLMAQHGHMPQLPLALQPPSYEEMTRLSASNPKMWHDICLSNKTAILQALAQFEQDLTGFKHSLLAGNSEELLAFFKQQNQLKQGNL